MYDVCRGGVKKAKILSSLFMNHPLLGQPDWTLKSEIKEIQIILRLFLVITMYCQASSSKFNQSLNLPRC